MHKIIINNFQSFFDYQKWNNNILGKPDFLVYFINILQ